ncbi:MAG: RagB/SusD family nutrient uptake outer membrane protein [Prolixibacteraceae bacterium]
MKNTLKGILILLVSITLFGACSDSFFDEKPSDRITPDQHYKSMIEAELSCLTPLSILRDVVPQMVFSCDLLSDMTTVTDNADMNVQNINNHVLSADNPYLDPSVLYQVIINANESLMHMDSIKSLDQDITDIDLSIFKGNLIGVRSWAYFMISRLYGEAAYIKDNLSSLPDEALTYIPRGAMMDTLINHLLPYLDIDYADFGNISMYNKALIGEIYLEKQDYTNAALYLQMAIEGFENGVQKYKVTTSYNKDSWKSIFVSAAYQSTEVMIAVPFNYLENQPNPIELWYNYDYEYLAKPTNYIVNLFEKETTVRDKEGDEYRGLGVSYDTIAGNYTVNKYNLYEGDPLSSDIILYRAADIHLLLAEALNRTGNSEIALQLLSEGYHDLPGWSKNAGIRGRAYLSTITLADVPEGANVVDYVEDLIVKERAEELAFEGKRWFDLMRVARRRGTGYLADKVAAKYSDGNLANKVREQLKDEKNWYLPFEK